MTENEKLAYLAGLFDGEGCVLFTLLDETSRGGLQIRVGNTDLDLLEAFVTTFGGSIHSSVPRSTLRRALFVWRLYGANAVRALEALMPFLVAKGPQAELAIKMRATSPGQRSGMAVQLKALKRIDHSDRFAAAQPEQEYLMKTKTLLSDFPLSDITTTRRFPTARGARQVVVAYRNGATIADLRYNFDLDSYDASTIAIRNLLVANGVTIRPRGRQKATVGAA